MFTFVTLHPTKTYATEQGARRAVVRALGQPTEEVALFTVAILPTADGRFFPVVVNSHGNTPAALQAASRSGLNLIH